MKNGYDMPLLLSGIITTAFSVTIFGLRSGGIRRIFETYRQYVPLDFLLPAGLAIRNDAEKI